MTFILVILNSKDSTPDPSSKGYQKQLKEGSRIDKTRVGLRKKKEGI
jgi:hypothetical protein